MSIGDTLAAGRRQAGLTVTQVSQHTCIRETIVRAIERDDFSSCGGDFYARGHIRSIARAVSVDPEPLIAEYDTIMGAPEAISAADVFQPVTPVRLKERRRPNWTAALAAAILVVVGVFAYNHFTGSASTASARSTAKVGSHVSDPQASGRTPAGTATPAATQHKTHKLRIRLTATQDCWVQLTSATGSTLFSGMIYAGNSMSWVERHTVMMQLGNPSGVKVLVNGKNKVPPGSVASLTLTLHA